MTIPTTIPKQFQKGFVPPFQTQDTSPGLQHKLDPAPIDDVTADGKPYKPAGKLDGYHAIITGADSGIGRAVAILFALEGAHLTLHGTETETKDLSHLEKTIMEKTSGRAKLRTLTSDLRSEENCQKLIEQHLDFHGGKLDTLILNHATQTSVGDITKLPSQQWVDTFNTNVHSFFYLSKAAMPHLAQCAPGCASIVFNASVNMAIGHPEMLDYTATKGAIVAFMRALSKQVVGEKGVRCNAVAPGPIWTPLIPSTMSDENIKTFGSSVPMERPGQPVEVATCFVFLASPDSSYISGQVMHVNGGVVIN